MKYKIIIFIIIMTIISGCSFINEDTIIDNNNIKIDDFIESQKSIGNNEAEIIDIETQKFEEEFENLIDLIFEASN